MLDHRQVEASYTFYAGLHPAQYYEHFRYHDFVSLLPAGLGFSLYSNGEDPTENTVP
jgi:hypothetical protein